MKSFSLCDSSLGAPAPTLSKRKGPRPHRLAWLGMALILVACLRQWVWAPALIRGPSMLPTLRDGQLAGINKLAYRFRPPARGEIVVFRTDSGLMVKRVVGVPGDMLSIREGNLYVNTTPLAEPYVKLAKPPVNIVMGEIERDCFVVAGDNRAESVLAIVSRWRIIGRLLVF